MKRKYVVPEINIEHYELTQSIAACGIVIGFVNEECIIESGINDADLQAYAAMGYFKEGSCIMGEPMMEENDGICYNTSTNAIFNS